jgi:crossover junction endonuclease EME1
LITRSPQYQRWISGLEKGTSAGSSKDAVPNLPSNQRSASDLGTSNKPAYPKLNAGSSKDGASSLPSYKRSISDIGASTKSTAPNTNALKRSKTRSTIIESDPIIFTSSPDPVVDARKRKEKQKRDRINQMLAISSDEVESDLHVPKKNQGKTKSAGKEPLRSGHGHVLRNFEISQSSDLDLPDLGAIPSQSDFKKSGRGKEKGKSAVMTALDRYEAEKAKERKQKEKEQKAKERLAAKETEKEQKRLAKEEKAREKDRAADLAKVNTLRTDKKVSTPEMIVDLPSCLNTLNPLLKEKIENFLKPVEAEYSEWQCKQPIIKWRRKIDAKFNEEAGHWEKVPSYIGTEKHVMCIMTAKEFVDLATGEEGKDLDSHVLGLKAKFDTNEIIYLIEGLEAWMRKNKNLQNRKFVQGVRSQMPEDAPAPSANQKRKKKKPELEYVDEDLIEDALLKLQVVHGALIHHTKVMIDTAEWVIIFTQHISTIPYRYVSSLFPNSH